MFCQANALELGHGPCPTFLARHTGKRERELDVGEHRLMRDEIVALEDEADMMIAIRIPIGTRVVFGGRAVDDELAGIGVVKTTQHVEQGGLTGT